MKRQAETLNEPRRPASIKYSGQCSCNEDQTPSSGCCEITARSGVCLIAHSGPSIVGLCLGKLIESAYVIPIALKGYKEKFIQALAAEGRECRTVPDAHVGGFEEKNVGRGLSPF